jgi:hypothetical protein
MPLVPPKASAEPRCPRAVSRLPRVPQSSSLIEAFHPVQSRFPKACRVRLYDCDSRVVNEEAVVLKPGTLAVCQKRGVPGNPRARFWRSGSWNESADRLVAGIYRRRENLAPPRGGRAARELPASRGVDPRSGLLPQAGENKNALPLKHRLPLTAPRHHNARRWPNGVLAGPAHRTACPPE